MYVESEINGLSLWVVRQVRHDSYTPDYYRTVNIGECKSRYKHTQINAHIHIHTHTHKSYLSSHTRTPQVHNRFINGWDGIEKYIKTTPTHN